jgi:hypothetical protein
MHLGFYYYLIPGQVWWPHAYTTTSSIKSIEK